MISTFTIIIKKNSQHYDHCTSFFSFEILLKLFACADHCIYIEDAPDI